MAFIVISLLFYSIHVRFEMI